jgi:hypothetical protein
VSVSKFIEIEGNIQLENTVHKSMNIIIDVFVIEYSDVFIIENI